MAGRRWIHRDAGRCVVRAHAKLNVSLEVLGSRSDGYHEVFHVMTELELHDVLTVLRSDDDALHLRCDLVGLEGPDNLALRAASALRERHRVRAGARIELEKRIPIAAGLGGGSSDAAATLVALSRLWGLELPFEELLELAAGLGSDVPYFLLGGLASCEGRGERVRALPGRLAPELRWWLLLKPRAGVSTADAYRGLEARHHTDGARGRGLRERVERGGELGADDLFNGMAASVFARFPEVAAARDALLDAGVARVQLCGTGSTVCAPFAEERSARAAAAKLRGPQGAEVLVTEARVAREERG